MNKVVARFADGRTVKGMTADFLQTRDTFHVAEAMADDEKAPLEIHTKDLKALFFVKDPDGDPHHVETQEFDPAHPPTGRRIRVTFTDGEVLTGTTTGYHPARPGFFLVPADPESNIERCWVVATSTQEVRLL